MLHEEARLKIKTTQLINRLQDHVLSGVEMSKSQVTAALGLLKKCVPDMAAVQHTGSDGGPITVIVKRFTDAGSNPPK